jgi:peptidoglycan/LPS O-acetylase OafA/YrhL
VQSKNIEYVERLDHLRFLAAATVLLFHTYLSVRTTSRVADPFVIPLIEQGHTGVPLFMVISGMILAMIADNGEITAAKFYLNRVLRIYPLFVFIVTLGYFATTDPRPTTVGINYLMSLLPISNLYRLEYGAYGGHLWSIGVELQFYLLFPLLLRFKRIYGVAYICGLAGLIIFFRIAVFVHTKSAHHLAFFSIFGNLEIFLAGMLAGSFFGSLGTKSAWWHRAWVLPIAFVALNATIFAMFLNRAFFHVDYHGVTTDGISRSSFWIFWPTMQAVLWAGFVLIYLRSELPIPFSRALATLGKYSYSMYVWHIAVLYALQSRFPFLSPYTFGLLVVLPATIALAAVSYHLIERPFLELRVRYVQRTEALQAS